MLSIRFIFVVTTMQGLSIRCYSKQIKCHRHTYHQLVFPLNGVIEIRQQNYQGRVVRGECILIPENTDHEFSADEQASFMVMDCTELPFDIDCLCQAKAKLDNRFDAFLNFVELQLQNPTDSAMAKCLFTTCFQLLTSLQFEGQLDNRMISVCEYIQANLANELNNSVLADKAYLSVTQFKKLFKQQLKLTPQNYVLKLRMEKARTLLCYTDTPIALVAEQVGYLNPSAFGRAFKRYFAFSPLQSLKVPI